MRPDTPQTTNLHDDLQDLAQRTADPEQPYLTVALDYRPDGTQPNRRPALRWLEEREQELTETLGPRGPAFDALTEGMRQMRQALDGFGAEVPQGIIFVAQPATGEFRLIPLAVPVENSIAVAPRPLLAPLARVADANPSFALLLADSKQAFLHTFALGTREREVSMYNAKAHLKPGAVSNRMIEWKALSAAEQQLENFAKAITEEIRRDLGEDQVQRLVIAADDQLTSTLRIIFPRNSLRRSSVPSRRTSAQHRTISLPSACPLCRRRNRPTRRTSCSG